MTELDDFRSETLARQTEAERALISGDPEPRLEMWTQRDPVTLFSAGGECRSGREEVIAFFRELGARFSQGSAFSYDVSAAEVSGDLAYTVGFERFMVSIAGGPVQERVIRVTHIYRREDGEWKIVHRHGDPGPFDVSPSLTQPGSS